jgi:hypothetical protein
MGKRAGVWLGSLFVLGGLLTNCGTEREGQAIGPPSRTVEQVREWPQGFEAARGGLRSVDVPPEAKKNLVEASADSAGSREFFHTLRR